MPTPNNLETRHSSFPDPQLPSAEEPWDSKASSPEVPLQADSVEVIVEASEVDSAVVIAEVSEVDLEALEVVIAEASAVVTVGVSVVDLVEDSAASEPPIN
jgi:hypothetical protein